MRNETIGKFLKGALRILICTEVVEEGNDIMQVGLVANFDLPNNKEQYIHRVGIMSDFGRKRVALNFILNNEADYLQEIKEFYQTSIDKLSGDLHETDFN